MFAERRTALRALHVIIVATLAALVVEPTVGLAANPPLSGASRIAVGADHACAALQSSGAMCWGTASFDGRLGRSTSGRAAGPVQGVSMPLQEVAAGKWHTCVATASGALYCFGSNAYGQLGVGSASLFSTAVPQQVVGLSSGVTAVAAGYDHSCAIAGGAARCWGGNVVGQLGNGSSQTYEYSPVQVSGLVSGVARISAGTGFSCAIVNGAAKCWGDGSQGQIGDGTDQQRLVPTQVTGLASGVAAIAAGMNHACAVVGGGVKCWGRNASGQLGDGTLAQRSDPVDVVGASSGIVALAAGDEHTCALRNNGAVLCWGDNVNGQLGDGTLTRRTIAGAVTGLSVPAVAIAAGGMATCVLLNDATVRCFGGSQLGINSLPARVKAVEVGAVPGGFAAIAAGGAHSCAVSGTGAAQCWGANDDGRLGDNSLVSRAFPVPVTSLGSGVTGIAAGSFHSCARTTVGSALCWGGNNSGQLGIGNQLPSKVPVPVTGLSSGVAQVAASGAHSCAVTAGGAAKCWGNNSFGQLGDGSGAMQLAPVGVAGLGSSVLRIALGNGHTCALRAGGGIKCWGNNSVGQLGDGTVQQRPAPTDVVGLTAGVTAVALGDRHSCASTTAGAVRCWGNNSNGELGDATTIQQRAFAYPVVGLGAGAVDLAAGLSHTCALLGDGTVRCWGANYFGQVGENGADPAREPVLVPLPERAMSISAGHYHSCAVLASGKARCWGDSSSSQLGSGDASYSPVPRIVVIGDFSTSVSVATAPNPSLPGEYVSITATVSAADTIPSGAVTFRDGGSPLLCNVFRGPVGLQSGKASCSVPLSLGVHALTAEYSGDGTVSPATGGTTHTVIALAGQHCAGFDDVDAAHAMCRNVEWVRNRAITLGCAGFAYCPGTLVNRLTMAAFMNRLGHALSPEVASHYSGFGTVLLWGVASCFTQQLASADYPRRAYVDAVVSGMVALDTDVEVAPHVELQMLPSLKGPATRHSFAANRVDAMRAQASFEIPAGETPRFSLSFNRIGSGSDYLGSASCTLRAVVVNRDETYSPFDQR